MLKIAAEDLECGYLDDTGFFYNWVDKFPLKSEHSEIIFCLLCMIMKTKNSF